MEQLIEELKLCDLEDDDYVKRKKFSEMNEIEKIEYQHQKQLKTAFFRLNPQTQRNNAVINMNQKIKILELYSQNKKYSYISQKVGIKMSSLGSFISRLKKQDSLSYDNQKYYGKKIRMSEEIIHESSFFVYTHKFFFNDKNTIKKMIQILKA